MNNIMLWVNISRTDMWEGPVCVCVYVEILMQENSSSCSLLPERVNEP